MATALAAGIVRGGQVPADSILAADPDDGAVAVFLEQVPGARREASNCGVVQNSDLVVLAVKPQIMPQVLSDLRSVVTPDQLFVSIAAGVTIKSLEAGLNSGRVIRVMPNTPCLVGDAAAGYCRGPAATADDGALVASLLECVGLALEFKESLLDAVTGLSGSGPAYVYLMIEALTEGGSRMGIPPEDAAQLAARTVRGAAEMVLATGQRPEELREQVTSPGGTTVAGLQALEEAGFRDAIISAVQAATERSCELGSD